MAQHWMSITFMGFMVGFTVIFCIWWFCNRVMLKNGRSKASFFPESIRSAIYRSVSQKDYELDDRHQV
jgi:membrane-associated phospholipid phosphatase